MPPREEQGRLMKEKLPAGGLGSSLVLAWFRDLQPWALEHSYILEGFP